MPFHPAADRDVHPASVPGVVACRCCPGDTSRSTRARRYPSDMTGAEWAVCELLLPAPAWLAGHGGRPASRCRATCTVLARRQHEPDGLRPGVVHGLLLWAFLRDARDQALVRPGAIVVAGDEDAPAVAEVLDIVDKPAGQVVHLRILPGLLEDYQAVIQRAVIPA